jgi:hypothetical protein
MYIRIEFKDIESDKTTETQRVFFSCPNGMFLSSYNSQMIFSRNLKDEVDSSVVFWYLDEDILNKCYSGAIHCLNKLLLYPGVKKVDIVPIEGSYNSDIKYDDLQKLMDSYGV